MCHINILSKLDFSRRSAVQFGLKKHVKNTGIYQYHRVETCRDVTSVPTFFVRMLGKILDACIRLDDNLMTTHFKLAEYAQLIIFRPIA